MVKGEASAKFENGFVRLVFTLADDVESQVRSANGIIIVSFSRPSRSPSSGSPPAPAASSARRAAIPTARAAYRAGTQGDGELHGRGRAAVRRLLPDTWTGLPPGLPREVIEELSQRAREADKKLRQQRALVRTNKMTPIRVRVARQPTFTRYVFDLPTMIGVVANNDKAKLTLTFDALLKFDLADAKATLPAVVGAIDSDVEQDASTVRFTFVGLVDVRTFRENLSFVVDVTSMEAKNLQPDGKPKSDDLSAMAADWRRGQTRRPLSRRRRRFRRGRLRPPGPTPTARRLRRCSRNWRPSSRCAPPRLVSACRPCRRRAILPHAKRRRRLRPRRPPSRRKPT